MADKESQLLEDIRSAFPEYDIGTVMCVCDGRPLIRIMHLEQQKAFLLEPFSPDLFPDADAEERFVDGVSMISILDYPGILKLVEHHRSQNGWHYVIYDHFEAVTLAELHERGEMKPQESVLLVAGACEPLERCHCAGVRHANLSLTSVLVHEKTGLVKVVNVGISDLLHPSDTEFIRNLTKRQPLSRHYVSPERLIEGGVSDHRCDIYSLGAIVYHLLVGSPPTGFAVLPSTRAKIEKQVDVVTMKAMHANPEHRHVSAEHFAAELRVLGAGHTNRRSRKLYNTVSEEGSLSRSDGRQSQ